MGGRAGREGVRGPGYTGKTMARMDGRGSGGEKIWVQEGRGAARQHRKPQRRASPAVCVRGEDRKEGRMRKETGRARNACRLLN